MKMLLEKDSDGLARQLAIEYLRNRLKIEEDVLSNVTSTKDVYRQRLIIREMRGTDIIVAHI